MSQQAGTREELEGAGRSEHDGSRGRPSFSRRVRVAALVGVLVAVGVAVYRPGTSAVADTPGTISTVYTDDPAPNTQGLFPRGLDWSAGTLYVAENCEVFCIPGAIRSLDTTNPSATPQDIPLADANNDTFKPTDVAAAPDGTLYFTSQADQSGGVYSVVPGSAVATLDSPLDMSANGALALDPSGRYLDVTASPGHGAAVPIISLDTQNPAGASVLPGSSLYDSGDGPVPLTWSGSDVYLASQGYSGVFRYSSGSLTAITSRSYIFADPTEATPASANFFVFPMGITSDLAGNLFVSISGQDGNAQVWEIYGPSATSPGTVHLVAGGGATSASAETAPVGTAATAVSLRDQLSGVPLTVDNAGNLYIGESDSSGGSRVYKVAGVAAVSHSLTASIATGSGDGTGTIACQIGTSGTPGPCASSYLAGTSVVLTGTPSGPDTAPVWTGCDSVSSDGTQCTVSMSSDKTVSVAFVPSRTLTVATNSADGTGGGRVVSTIGGISCGEPAGSASPGDPGTVCSESVLYANGSPGVVSLNAVPDTASYLSGWDGCDSGTQQITCTVTLGSAKTVTASFQTCPTGLTCNAFTGPDTTFASVCPIGGTTFGGSLVTLTGADLASTDTVLFDNQPATYVSGSGTSMTVRAPSHAAGQVPVTIQGLSGYSANFTYENAVPQITGASPRAVSYSNPASVTLTGTSLFDVSQVFDADQGGKLSGYQASCDGTHLTFTPPAGTVLSIGNTALSGDNITVSTGPAGANGTSNDFFLHRSLPYTQDGGQVINGLQPDYADVLPSSEATQAFTDEFGDNNGGTVDVTVPAGDLPSGTLLNVYSGKAADLVSQMPAGVTVVGGWAVAWTAPDGSHPIPSQPVSITIHDPTITPSKTVYAADGSGGLAPLIVETFVPAGVNNLLVLDGSGNFVANYPVFAGELISGDQVIAAGGGNVIAAGGGNVIAAGGGNLTYALMSSNAVIAAGGGNVIAAGGGNVIAAGGGNVIAAGGGNVIASMLGSAGVIAAGGGNVIAAGGGNVIAAGGGNIIGNNFSALIAMTGNGFQTLSMPDDPEIVLADPPAAPGAPTGVTATASGTQATVSWTASSPGGAAITAYSVQEYVDGQARASTTFAGTATSETISGLASGHSYTFTVAAFNGGYGPASDPSGAVTVSGGSSPTGGGSPTSGGAGSGVAAGATYTSSSSPPSAANPVVVTVTTPVAGDISVKSTTGLAATAGYEAFGQALQITAPAASAIHPLVISFEVDRSALPAGVDDNELTVTRDGVPAAPCLGDTAVGSADPCVTSVVDHGSYVTITVLSTHASTWSEVAATSDRVAGVDRIGTAIATSQMYFVPGQSTAAVLAREDDYADALAGAPLASAKGGPLLLSDSEALPAAVAAELTRALVPGSSVYLLGGTSALSLSVEQSVAALGFKPVRIAGPDRYATAVAVAEALGNPSTALLASGVDFPDALAAGAAAAHTGAAVLLTTGTAQPAATARYLADHPGITLYAIGGPAAQAAPGATAVVGADRYATAVAVAQRFFPSATAAGLASGLGYPDALSAGPVLGAHGEPLVLTDPHTMTAATGAYIRSGIRQLHVFGGTAAVMYDPGSYLSAAAPNARGRHLAAAHRDRSRPHAAGRSWWQSFSGLF